MATSPSPRTPPSRAKARPSRPSPPARRRSRPSRSTAGSGRWTNPRTDTYELDLDKCGPMVLDALIKIKNEIDTDADLPPLLPRGHLRFLRDEHRRHQHAGLHQADRRHEGRRAIYPLPHMPVVKDLVPDLSQLLRAAPLDRALAEDRDRRRRRKERLPVQGGARQARRPVRVHPVRLLLDLLPELLVERRPLPRPGDAAAGLSLDRRRATRRRANGSTIWKIRSGSIAATRS
jgi:hypothetical protein